MRTESQRQGEKDPERRRDLETRGEETQGQGQRHKIKRVVPREAERHRKRQRQTVPQIRRRFRLTPSIGQQELPHSDPPSSVSWDPGTLSFLNLRFLKPRTPSCRKGFLCPTPTVPEGGLVQLLGSLGSQGVLLDLWRGVREWGLGSKPRFSLFNESTPFRIFI